mmetsp:Transcript_57027/g.83672  ORF Transcript_57027/g.83672 Transcript_57027/m.83672 type:complete len:226 (+) Transcript_57027:585-1262(+)
MVAIMLLATALCMPDILTGPSGSTGTSRVGAANVFLGAAGVLPAAASTSASVIRPKLPVPTTLLMSILFFLAAFLASGDAITRPAGITPPPVRSILGPSSFFFSVLTPPAPALKFSTSEAVMRPAGPVPMTSDRLIPRSAARDLAIGEATTRSPAPRGVAGGAAPPMGAAAGAGAEAGAATAAGAPPMKAAAAATAGMSASVAAIRATVAPTAAESPSSTMILAR